MRMFCETDLDFRSVILRRWLLEQIGKYQTREIRIPEVRFYEFQFFNLIFRTRQSSKRALALSISYPKIDSYLFLKRTQWEWAKKKHFDTIIIQLWNQLIIKCSLYYFPICTVTRWWNKMLFSENVFHDLVKPCQGLIRDLVDLRVVLHAFNKAFPSFS